jgi:heme-degrading monooxygenase HmoA
MLVVTRFMVGRDDTSVQADFVDRAQTALRVLGACRGYVRGRLARSLDEPDNWLLVTEWASVGAYRRALSSYDVKVHATPLLAESADEPSAYEVLADAPAGGDIAVTTSDRAELR